MAKPVLCIAGPLDGQWVNLDDDYLSVPYLALDAEMDGEQSMGRIGHTVKQQYFMYYKQAVFNAYRDDQIKIFAPSNWTQLDIMTRLCQQYEPRQTYVADWEKEMLNPSETVKEVEPEVVPEEAADWKTKMSDEPAEIEPHRIPEDDVPF